MSMKNKERNRILISIIGFSQGGAEIMPIRIANYLHTHHYEVGVHCVKRECDPKIRNLLHSDIPVFYTDQFWKLAAIILKYRYTVLHSHSVASQLLVARMKKRVPFIHIQHVATSHGGYEGMDSAEAVETIRKVDSSVSCWTYVAGNNLKLFQLANISEQKLSKIGNAMEVPQDIRPVQWEEYGISKNAIVFTVITRAVWKKCWKECIQAIQKARELSGRDIHLVLGGTGPVYEELKQNPQEEFVHLVGTVIHPCDFYKASYCGLLLSVRECAPLGIIEMYQAGVPVVATDTGDIREMLLYKENPTGILVSLTEKGEIPVLQAAEAICKMVQDTDFYAECRETAMKKAHEFCMEYVMEKYFECYQKSAGIK